MAAAWFSRLECARKTLFEDRQKTEPLHLLDPGIANDFILLLTYPPPSLPSVCHSASLSLFLSLFLSLCCTQCIGKFVLYVDQLFFAVPAFYFIGLHLSLTLSFILPFPYYIAALSLSLFVFVSKFSLSFCFSLFPVSLDLSI